jgi:hypothetical protein
LNPYETARVVYRENPGLGIKRESPGFSKADREISIAPLPPEYG